MPGEVFLEVINDVVRAHGTQHVQFAGLVDDGHLNVIEFGDLQGERTNAPTCPVQEQSLAGPNPAHIDEGLHRQHARLRDGGGLLAVNLITRLERLDVFAHGLNTPGDITADDLHLRCEETIENANDERRTPKQPPVPIVDGRGMHADEDFIGLGRRRGHVP